MGLTEKTVIVGEGLNDDLWHTVTYSRRGMTVEVAVDDEQPLIGENELSCVYDIYDLIYIPGRDLFSSSFHYVHTLY